MYHWWGCETDTLSHLVDSQMPPGGLDDEESDSADVEQMKDRCHCTADSPCDCDSQESHLQWT